jgi:2-(1,2-epoxy-1,2-dihydrophenyl)acetyl-CoA isomerase
MTGSRYRSVDGLDVELAAPVLHLRLDRPAQRNAVTDEMMHVLIEAIAAAGQDEDVRAIHITGRGDNFCGGADILTRNAGGEERRPRAGSIQRRLPHQAHRLLPLLCTVQVPVVCQVRGWAAGIGLQIAAAADFTVADECARFWAPFSARGFTPDSGATWLIPRLVGPIRARELLLLGRELSGREAVEWGLIHRAVPDDQLDDTVNELVERVAAGPTVSLGLTKWLLLRGAFQSLDDHLADEALALELSSRSEDFREGLRAFSDRRPPEFRGR